MIKQTNTRIMITFSKAQANWLKTQSKKLNMTISNFVKFLIDKNIGHLIFKLPKEKQQLIFKIAQTKWLDFDTREDNTDDMNPFEFLTK